VTNGRDSHFELEKLNAAVTTLLHTEAAPETGPGLPEVTETVTQLTEAMSPVIEPVAPEIVHALTGDEIQVARPRAVTAVEVIDSDSVRVVRGSNFEVSGSYHALAVVGDDEVLIGSVQRSGRAAWQALTPSFIRLTGGPWRTRQDALVQLLLNHEQTRAAHRRSRHRFE
jgi:hypothetical protein